ncbi:hypothetical protein ACPOL_0917 [Acidisarcina polymorpha]|uniref:DUF4175 family protein n=1 Tax=Acidisarcina polymorpha TaxID=2211140 RepID=A0A2Z5FU90_9BACT|nr:DUF4175 family protein [Acidisarcina polymorpha]AXC10272.1 hypothetical protein ACPOL_0917 [Acidisarcina polymorpha]
MSKQDELNSYIARLQSRLRLSLWLRGAAIFTGTALAVTLTLVLALNHFAFPMHAVAGARLVLLIALATAAGFGILLPVMGLTRTLAVRRVETANPELEQRLTTFYEGQSKQVQNKAGNPFLELLAADTLARTQYAPPASLVPDNRLFALGGAGLACLAVLAWMISAAPGYLGYGASLLWTGPKKNAAPLYAITITPGDIAVRRHGDQIITAHVSGMHPDKVQLFAHYQSGSGWEPVVMQTQPDAGGAAAYQFVFTGLPENVEYYVAAGPLTSPHYKVRVVDLPSVKEIQVTYHYPQWTGMKPVSEEHTGDLRAIEGTDAKIQVEMDHALKDGQLTLDNGQAIYLTGGNGNKYQGSIHMEKDGAYHVAANDEGQSVRLSEDYFIATDKAPPPQIAVERPGGDYRASPIEEVTTSVKAADEFGLRDVHLHYSVNGGADHDVSMLKAPGPKSVDGSYTLPLEDYKLAPGDLVSLYATAKDGHLEARTDITFIQVDPFEREFSQSQQGGGPSGGGGAGGQNNQTEISKREKELIAATWKQQNDKSATAKDAAAAGQFLSGAQQKLRGQVLALSERMQSRDLSEANEEFTGFDKDMQTAAAAMQPSADQLKSMRWKDALPLEQKALQALLRAEATFRKIEVAFGQRGGGAGGGGESAGRDLASLFDLELDTEKNQYETAQSASPQEQHEKDVEDALAKLDALAKRQEELAGQQHNPQQSFQERWQQEMLRREAEELQRQIEQLARNGQQNANGSQSGQASSQSPQSDSQQSGSQQPGSQAQNGSEQHNPTGQSGSQSSGQKAQGGSASGSSGQSSRRSSRASAAQQAGQAQPAGQSSDQRIQQALSRLQQAGDAMKRSGSPQQSSDAARQAADRLREATNLLAGTQQQLASGKTDALSHEADRLTQEERSQAERIDKLASQQGAELADRDSMMARIKQRDQLAKERQQLSNDLSKLQKNLRDSAREMASNQPGVAKKLRDAVSGMDDADLDNHVQRTADWLRRGINPNANGTESEIAQGLQHLSEQLRQAQQGQKDPTDLAQGAHSPGAKTATDQQAALDQVERLRSQLEAMQAASRGASGRNGESDPEGRKSGQPQQAGGQQAAPGQAGQPGSGLRRGGGIGDRNGDIARNRQGDMSGEVRNGGGASADGTAWNNVNTGNNRYGAAGQRFPAVDSSGNPADPERSYRQGLRQLSELRQAVKDDPEAAKEVEKLTRQMQQLDPSRFLGNPALVEQMHQDVLNSVDRLELQLQHDEASGDARSGRPYVIPAGYQDSVAEYYRRLSKNP